MANNVQQLLTQTAAGELATAENTPLTQINAQYGLGLNVFTVTDAAGTGTTTAANGKFVAQSGTSATSLASISTLRELTLRIGQGAIGRIKGSFTQGVAGSLQTLGLFNAENALTFGFLGVDFGILYAHDGNVEHQELTVTTPAAGSENATITVDGTPFTVPLTVGTVQHNAIEIADSLEAQVVNYRFTANDDQVVALAVIPGPQGSFAFSSATAVAAWVQIEPGVDLTIELIKQADWNIDALTDFTLDPTKLNGYQIKYTVIGAVFGVVTPDGEIRTVHLISGVNTLTLPYVTSTSFRVGSVSRNLGNTTNLTVEFEAAAGFVEGKKRFDSGINAEDATGLAIGTAAETVFVIRNRISFGGRINRAELLPRFISASTDTNKTAFYELIINPTFSSDLIFDYVDKTNSIAEVSEDNVTFTGGKLIGGLTATTGGPGKESFNDEENTDVFVSPGDIMAVVARVSSGAAAEMNISFSWQEDV